MTWIHLDSFCVSGCQAARLPSPLLLVDPSGCDIAHLAQLLHIKLEGEASGKHVRAIRDLATTET